MYQVLANGIQLSNRDFFAIDKLRVAVTGNGWKMNVIPSGSLFLVCEIQKKKDGRNLKRLQVKVLMGEQIGWIRWTVGLDQVEYFTKWFPEVKDSEG